MSAKDQTYKKAFQRIAVRSAMLLFFCTLSENSTVIINQHTSCFQIQDSSNLETSIFLNNICKYFLSSCVLSFCFILFMVSFAVQKFLSLIRSHLFIFVFISITLEDELKKTLLRFITQSVLPMFSSKCLIVPGLTFRSLIHFKLIFLYGVIPPHSFFYLL